MKKPLGIWITLVLLLLLSLPGIFNRWTVESSNNTVELIVPYEEIYELSHKGISVEEALYFLKKAGLTSVSLSPTTLADLDEQGIISIFNEDELYKALYFTENHNELINLEDGYYISIPTNSYYDELLVKSLNPTTVTVAGERFYFSPKEEGVSRSRVIGYDENIIELIESNQLDVIYRARNTLDSDYIVASLVDLPNPDARLIFTGAEVLGYPDPISIKNWSKQLSDAGYSFYFIEFSYQSGLQAVANISDYNILRLHSINLDQNTLSENVKQAVRAIKERNIRSILFHLPTDDADESLKNGIAFIEDMHQELPNQFHFGVADSFQNISIPGWVTYILLLSGVIFTFLFSAVLKNKWITIGLVAMMMITAITYVITERLLFLQAFVLGIAIISPAFSILASVQIKERITTRFSKAIGITFVGIYITVGLLNGNEFITGMEVFRGVKLVYILPILITGFFLFIGRYSSISNMKSGVMKVLNSEVRYWQLFLFLLVGAIGLYYISRSGNGGAVTEIELLLRNKLEDILYIRPRTKEFLIGFPLFILGLHVLRKHEMVGRLLLLIGVIGFLSMFNTFTHFHIPLHISLLRTIYSIFFGYVVGMSLIYLYNNVFIYIFNKIQKRWI